MSRISTWLAGGGLMIAAFGFTIYSFGYLKQQVDVGPDVVVDPPLVVIDSARSDEGVATVRLINRGSHPVRFLDISSSCGCTLADPPEQKSLEPGQSTTLRVRGTPPQVGKKTTYVQIETDSPSSKWVRVNLLLKGDDLPVPRLSRSPDKITLPILSQRIEVATKAFKVDTIEREGSDHWILNPPLTVNNLTLEPIGFKESEGPEDGLVGRSYLFKVSAQVDFKQTWEQSFQLTTSTSTTIPIRIVAEYTPPIRIVPNTLFIDATSGDLKRCTRTVLVVGNDKSTRAEIQYDKPADDWLNLQRIDDHSSDAAVLARFEVSLSAVPPTSASSLRCVIQLHSNHPECPTLELPIIIKGIATEPSR